MDNTWSRSEFVKKLDRCKRNILYAYIQTASVEMYRQWVADGKQVPIEDVIEMTNQLLCQGVYGLIGSNLPM